ncbi:MAG: RodZ domain-containing protein [Pseudomonadota bacterium]
MAENVSSELELVGLMDGFPLGDVLRGERATRNKSLEDVQNELRIKAHYIDAIENLDTSVFETAGFVSGYIRSYARYLNLDPEDVFARFCDEADFEPPLRFTAANTNKAKPEGLAGTAFAGHSNLEKERWWERISLAGIGSLVVLIMLLGGVGYAGYSIFVEVQKVRWAPLPEAPAIADAGPAAAEKPSFELGLETVQASLPTAKDTLVPLSNFYRPQLLDTPVLVPRDGPISQIDLVSITTGGLVNQSLDEAEQVAPQVTAAVASGVEVFAAGEAWISVVSPTQGTLFEKILAENTRYRVPIDVTDAVLRAGNSGSVFLIVDGQAYGPVGSGTRVAKNVVLESTAISGAFPVSVNPTGYDPQVEPVNLAHSDQ